MNRSSVILILVLTLSGCDGGSTGPKPVAIVSLSPPVGMVEVGQTLQLTAVAKDGAGNVLTGRTIEWSSSDVTVATVSGTGLVTGVGTGAAMIIATCEGMIGSALVTVTPLPVASVEVSPANDTIEVGQTLQLTATVKDAAGNELTGRTVTWSSDEESVATVSGTGLVAGVAVGEAGITATSEGSQGGASVTVTPVPMQLADVSAGGSQTCGWNLEDEAYCWGSGIFGQLGNGSEEDQLVPTSVSGGLAWGSLSAGYGVTCGVTRQDEAYCWGSGDTGQLGNGSRADQSEPAPVSGGLTWASVTPGAYHTCGVTLEDEAYCWGMVADGRLGNGSGELTFTPVPTPVSGGLAWASVSAGPDHTCGVTVNGDAYCWGRGEHGKLGNGSEEDQYVPMLVSGGLTWSSVSVGGYHTCGVTIDGEAYCWGHGNFGKLGNGSEEAQLVPTPVSGGLVWVSVSAGDSHTCGVTLEDGAYCWGSNSNGQLGNGLSGLNEDKSLPTPVSRGLAWASLSAGGGHTCGVTEEGKAYCSGRGDSGVLGNGSEEDKTVPWPVRGG